MHATEETKIIDTGNPVHSESNKNSTDFSFSLDKIFTYEYNFTYMLFETALIAKRELALNSQCRKKEQKLSYNSAALLN